MKSPLERMSFTLAGYNGGPFHIRDAMALAKKNGKDPYRWADVSEFVLKLQQPEYYRDPVVKYGYMRGSETVDYVEEYIIDGHNIVEWLVLLLLLQWEAVFLHDQSIRIALL